MSIVANINASAKLNNNNDARNLRITQTPKAIRDNQYNIFTNSFDPKPSVVSTTVNSQKLSVTFSVNGKAFYHVI